jgi:hypothetical protein
MLHADDIEAMDSESDERQIALEMDSWDITSFNQSMPMGILLDAGVNFDIRDEEKCMPDLGGLGTKALLALDPDLPGIAEFQNEEFGRGDELEPLTLEEHAWVLATYGDEEIGLQKLIEAVTAIQVSLDAVNDILPQVAAMTAEMREEWSHSEDEWEREMAEWTPAVLRDRRWALMKNIRKVQGLHDRLRRSMQIDSIGNEWTYQSRNGIGHREGVVADMATQADELPKSQQYQDDDLQDKLVAAEATNLVNFLYNTTGRTLETKGGIKVAPMGKMLGPDESNYFRRSKEKKESFVEGLHYRIARSDERGLRILRQKINTTYAKSVQHCVPQAHEGEAAVGEMKRRGMQLQKKRVSKATVPASRSVTEFQLPAFTRCQRWHKLRLTKEQKAELVNTIDERLKELQGEIKPEVKAFVQEMARTEEQSSTMPLRRSRTA